MIKCLELFKAVADHKSFSGAALANNLAPAAVTRAIQELETELGVRLIHRTTRKLSVTDVGMTVYNRAVLLLESFTEIKEIGDASSRTMSGTVRVAIQKLLGFNALSSLLEGYMQSHSNVTVDVDFFDDGDDPLSRGADIAVSLEHEVRDLYIAKKIGSLSMSLFAGTRFSTNTNAGSPYDLLPQERMSVGGSPWDLLAEGSGKRLLLPCGSRFRSSSPQAIAMAAIQGIGIALLPPDAAKPYVDAGQLFPLFDAWHSESVPIAISYRSRQFVPERVRSLISHVSENFDLRDRRNVDRAIPMKVACSRPTQMDDISLLLALDS